MTGLPRSRPVFRPWTKPKLTGSKMKRSPAAGTVQNGANPIQIADNSELEKFLERLREKILPPFQNFGTQLVRWNNKPTGTQLAEALASFGPK